MLDGNRLVGEERRLDPNGQVGLDLGHGVLDVAPEGEDVAARPHGYRETDAFSSVDAEDRLRRVGRAAGDVYNVAQTDGSAVRDEAYVEDVLLGSEGARNTHKDLLVPGLHHARGGDGVLGLERGDRRFLNVKALQLLGREFHVHSLVLRPEDIDLRDVWQLGEGCALRTSSTVSPQLPVGESVRGEAVDDAIGVAELVVEADAGNSLRQGVADIAHLLARTWYQMSDT